MPTGLSFRFPTTSVAPTFTTWDPLARTPVPIPPGGFEIQFWTFMVFELTTLVMTAGSCGSVIE